MFRRFNQISILHGIKTDSGFLSGSLTSLQISRQSTGGLEKNEVSKSSQPELGFIDFMKERQAQARRSFVAQMPYNEWSPLVRLCCRCGTLRKVYHYSIRAIDYVLVEMSSEDELFRVLDYSHGTSIGSHQFVTCNRTRQEDHSYKLYERDLEKISYKAQIKPNFSGIINKHLARGNMSTNLENISNEFKISDFGIRLRFLMTRQLEALLEGLLPRTTAYPFGSTVTGFGAGNCDLDVVVLPEEFKASFFSRSDLWTADREKAQLHLSVIADVIGVFLKGCNNLVFIKNARVPIVRYTNTFTTLQCDLSLYNNSAVTMSQMLYVMSTIDERVQPLVLAIKMWAEKCDLAMKPSTNSLSNFCLTLLVIFFLQQKSQNFDAVLPPWKIFPSRTNFLVPELQIQKCVKEFKRSLLGNRRTLEELFLSFFIYYSQFDFKTNGVSLLTGEVIGKKTYQHFPLYIENPVLPDLNVSKHVNSNGIMRFRKLVRDVCDIIKDDNFSLEDVFFAEKRRRNVNVKSSVG